MSREGQHRPQGQCWCGLNHPRKPESVSSLLRRLVPAGSILEIQKLPDRRGYRVRAYAFGATACDVDGRTLNAALMAALKGSKP